jgi:putative acetyltransferase
VLIRRELPPDTDAIRAVHLTAFSPPPDRADPAEAQLVDDLRADPAAWLPPLSLVAEDPEAGAGRPGEVVGHVVCTRATLTGAAGRLDVLGLGPLGVRPDRQGRGVGSALVHAVLAAADALGEPLVVLLGDPAYYVRFGFVTAADLGVRSPVEAWGAYFQARPLTAHDAEAHRGAFAYASPFDGL